MGKAKTSRSCTKKKCTKKCTKKATANATARGFMLNHMPTPPRAPLRRRTSSRRPPTAKAPTAPPTARGFYKNTMAKFVGPATIIKSVF